MTASIGVAIGRYDSPDALLRDADLALYSAKAAGKDRYELFDASMYAGAKDRLTLETDLGRAIEEGQLFLAYQPIVDLATRRLRGVEALLRWKHPERGVILPEDFIPLAEDSGLIAPIGRWALENACRQAAEWAAAGHPTNISVNVSAAQLGRRGLTEDVKHALAVSGLPASLLTLEVTETTLTGDVEAAGEHLRAAQAARRAGGDRRLRHRLCVAVAAAADAGGHPQDRPGVRGRAGQRPPGPGPAGSDRGRRPSPLAVGDRRGRGGRVPAAGAPGDGL